MYALVIILEKFMSDMQIGLAVNRIKDSDTPLAVFVSGKQGSVNVVFAETAQTVHALKVGTPSLIGVFDRNTPTQDVLRALMGGHV